jgi:hypothetical protein
MRRTHLKDQLEDLVDRTGRVEDMLEVLAGIYRERARTPDYAELRDDMLATAHVLHEASEAVAGIFDEEDEEALEHGAERAAWQARHEEGRGNPPPLRLKKVHLDLYTTLDGAWHVVRIFDDDGKAWWYWVSVDQREGGQDWYWRKWQAVEGLADWIKNREKYLAGDEG